MILAQLTPTATPPAAPSIAPPPPAAPPAATPTKAPAPGLRVEAPAEVPLGATFPYVIELTHPAGEALSLSPKVSLAPYTLNGVRHSQRQTPEGQVVDRWELSVGAYALDAEALPAFELERVTAEGAEAVEIPARPLRTRAALAEEAAEAEPAALVEPLPVYVTRYTPLYWLAGALVALALGLWLWRRWRARPPAPAPVAPPVPCEQQALASLEALRAEALYRRGRYREHFFRLSEILRAYLGARYGVDALERTTPELLEALRGRLPQAEAPKLRAWSEGVDLVKYAKVVPAELECARALEEAFALVEATRPPPPAAEEGA